VGGLYAAGRSPEELQEILTTVNWNDIFADQSPRRDLAFRRKQDERNFPAKFRVGVEDWKVKLPLGLIEGQKLKRLLDTLTLPVSTVRDFDDLPLPYRAVATDIVNGQPVAIGQGNLANAIRASMSIPAAFAPVEIDGRLLVDGGISMNVPVEVAQQMGADVVIAVDVGTPPLTRDELQSALSITGQMISLLMQVRTEQQIERLEQQDILISPDLTGISTADFAIAVEAVARGVEAALAKLPELQRYAVSEQEFAAHLARQRNPAAPAPVIDVVRVVNQSDVGDDVIRAQIHQPLGEPLDVELLNKDLSRLYGYDVFALVDFSLEKEDEGTALVIHATRFAMGRNRVRLGLNLDTDFRGRSLWDVGLQLTRLPLTENMGELRIEGRIGSEPGLQVEWFQPLDDDYRWFVAPQGEFGFREVTLFSDGQALADFGVRAGDGSLAVGRQLGNWGEVRAGVFLGDVDAHLESSAVVILDGQIVNVPKSIDTTVGGWFTRFAVDTLDNTYFPTSGGLLSLEFTGNEEAMLADFSSVNVQSNGLLSLSWGANTLTTGYVVSAPLDGFEPGDLAQVEPLGGFLRLSGLRPNELFGPYLILGRAIAYRRIADPRVLSFGLPVYLGVSLESGNVYADADDITWPSLLWGGSAFLGLDTPLGPVFFGYGYTEGGNNAVFLSVGRFF
jgi:NTE family protein